MNYTRDGRWVVAFLLMMLVGLATPALAQEGPNDGPAYMIIATEDTMRIPDPSEYVGTNDASDLGTHTIMVKVGDFLAGFGPEDTIYVGLDLNNIDVSNLPFPFEDLNGNPVTVIGAARAFGDDLAHLFTPTPDPIPRSVQEAFFNATDALALIADGNPKTGDIAQTVFENQGGAGASLQEIMETIFVTNRVLNCTTCRAEGELFPHNPIIGPLFTFDITLDETGAFAFVVEEAVVTEIVIDVSPGSDKNSVNVESKNGTLTVAVITTDDFNALDVDPDTVLMGGVAANSVRTKDVNRDGRNDLVFQFDVPDLVAAGAIDVNTEELTLIAETFDGERVQGTDMINVVKPKGGGGGNGKNK